MEEIINDQLKPCNYVMAKKCKNLPLRCDNCLLYYNNFPMRNVLKDDDMFKYYYVVKIR
jgi:hypothetical protein